MATDSAKTARKPESGFGKAKPLPGSFRVAALQMASGPQVSSNLAEAERLLRMAVEQGASLVGLPEYFSLMGLRDTDKVQVAESFGKGPVQEFLARMARRFKVWIVGGSLPLKSPDPRHVYNSSIMIDSDGNCVARYDKIHLFSFSRGQERYEESTTLFAGSEVVSCDTPFGRIGLSLCYDLRFPELFRAMGPVDLIFTPSAFTETTGKAHWDTLVRARAIENLAYVVAPAQGGYHMNGRETHGHSMIVDPWGVVLDQLPRGSGVVIAGVNPVHQAELRANLPALEHRTLGLAAPRKARSLTKSNGTQE